VIWGASEREKGGERGTSYTANSHCRTYRPRLCAASFKRIGAIVCKCCRQGGGAWRGSLFSACCSVGEKGGKKTAPPVEIFFNFSANRFPHTPSYYICAEHKEGRNTAASVQHLFPKSGERKERALVVKKIAGQSTGRAERGVRKPESFQARQRDLSGQFSHGRSKGKERSSPPYLISLIFGRGEAATGE